MPALGLCVNAANSVPDAVECDALGLAAGDWVRTHVAGSLTLLDGLMAAIPSGVAVMLTLNNECIEVGWDWSGWEQACRLVATRYANRVKIVGCGNELDLWHLQPPIGDGDPSLTPAFAADLVRRAAPILRPAGVKVAMSSVASGSWPDYLREMARRCGDQADYADLHVYAKELNGIPAGAGWQTASAALREAARISGLPVISSEAGIKVDDAGGLEAQAQWAAGLGSLPAELVCCWCWHDRMASPGETGGQAFGARGLDNGRKPLWFALQRLFQEPTAIVTPDPGPARGARILSAAAAYNGVPYALPPDGVTTLDCSLFVLAAYRDAGFPFPSGVRTAEQLRQACELIRLDQLAAGDLLFFEHTYEPGGAPGPDGKIASHVGISYGSGTGRMWDAHQSEARDGVGITNIYSDYWQSHLLLRGGRFAPAVVVVPPAGGGFIVSGTGSSGLRVRGAPGTEAPILGTLPDGSRVSGDEHAWRKIRGGRLDGWVADTFLEPSAAPPPGPGAGDPWTHWSAATIAGICNVPTANVEQHWPHLHAALAERGIDDRLVQTAAIATIAIETASTFRPVREAFWLDEEWRRQNLTRYYPFYGRGHIQLTWETTYAACGAALGVDLVGAPDLALEDQISAQVLALFFDEHGVAEAAREADWGEVRRRVQGGHVGLDRLLVIVHALEAA